MAEEPLQSLLVHYENYYPFHQNLENPMPVDICDESGCSREIQVESNIEKFHSLLKKTESQYDIRNTQFVASPLGRYYRALKNFVMIQEELDTCQMQAPLFTKENLSHSLQRLSANVSTGELDNSCQIHQDNNILSDDQFGFASDMIEFQLRNKLILDSLQRSIEARITFEKKFNKKDIGQDAFVDQFIEEVCQGTVVQNVMTRRGSRQRSVRGDICSSEDKNLLTMTIQEKVASILQSQKQIPTMSAEQVRRDINSKIAEMNSVLQRYNQEQEALKRQWNLENAEDLRTYGNREYLYRVLPQKRRARREELTRRKQSALDEYFALYATLHESGAGNLLQTDAIKNAAGISELERVRAKWLGLGGFEPIALQELEASFPMLKPINHTTSQGAMQESLRRTQSQIVDLLKLRQNGSQSDQMEELAYLITVSPLSAGHVLFNNPQYTDTFCKVAQNIAKEKRNQIAMDAGVFLVLGVGMAVAFSTTLGGSMPLTATLAGLISGGGLTVGEYIYQKNEANKIERDKQPCSMRT